MANAHEISIELRETTERQFRKLVLDITADAIKETPLDTGWARANWVPSLRDRDEPAGSRGSVETSSQSRGMVDAATAKIGDTVYINNNVPYIGELNRGHSPQAPPGYVDAIIARRVNEANR